MQKILTPKTSYEFSVIGYIGSCYKEKFGIPRQPGLVTRATATLTLLPEYSHPDIVRGLEYFSHIWILFVFHQSMDNKGKNTVRPPRLGGNERMGVFATRSNFRPNPLGQSVVKMESIDTRGPQIDIQLSGIDLLHGTPVLDIKPYLKYADAIDDANHGEYYDEPESKMLVTFSELALVQLKEGPMIKGVNLKEFIIELLSYDPRPAYVKNKSLSQSKIYACRVWNVDIKWIVECESVQVLEVVSYSLPKD